MFDIEKTLKSMERFNERFSEYVADHMDDKELTELDGISLDMYIHMAELIEDVQTVQDFMLKKL